MAQKKSFRAFMDIKMIVFTRQFFWDEKIFEKKNFFHKSCFYCIFELLGFGWTNICWYRTKNVYALGNALGNALEKKWRVDCTFKIKKYLLGGVFLPKKHIKKWKKKFPRKISFPDFANKPPFNVILLKY